MIPPYNDLKGLIVMSKNSLTKQQKWLLLGIPVIFLVAAAFHFVFDITGENKVVGLFVPVNESVWEHLKMLVLPIILWWSVYYIVRGEKLGIDKNKWFFGCLVALITALLFQLAFFYTYSQALGIESLALDILDTMLSVMIGQLVGMHVYRYSKGINWVVSIIILVGIVFMFAWFTLNTPELPIFLSSVTGTYGI